MRFRNTNYESDFGIRKPMAADHEISYRYAAGGAGDYGESDGPNRGRETEVAISLDLYLIGRVIVGSIGGGLLSTGMLAIYLTLWFLLPRVGLIQRLPGFPK